MSLRVKVWRTGGAFFEHRPDITIKTADAICVIDVNEATLDLYRAQSKEAVIESTRGEMMSSGELRAFREQLIAFAGGETQFTIDAEELTMNDSEILTRIYAGIVPAYRDDWSRIFCIVEKKTEREQAETAIVTEQVSTDDLAFWEAIKDSATAEDYKAYLETFPEGIFAPLARRRTGRMGAMAKPCELSPTLVGPQCGLDFDWLNERAKENTEQAKSKAANPLY